MEEKFKAIMEYLSENDTHVTTFQQVKIRNSFKIWESNMGIANDVCHIMEMSIKKHRRSIVTALENA